MDNNIKSFYIDLPFSRVGTPAWFHTCVQ